MRKRWVVIILALVTAVVATTLAVSQFVAPPVAPVPSAWRPPTSLPTARALPTTTFAFDSDRTGNFELFTMPLAGGSARRLTNDPAYDSWSPRLSPDRRTILFHRTPKGVHDLDQSKVSIWVTAVDGTGTRQLRPAGLDGWYQQGHAEWAPDGSEIVLFGGSRINPQIFVTNQLGQSADAVTDRPGTNLDPAFTPDGSGIVFVGCAQAVCNEQDYEIYRMSRDGSNEVRLTDDDVRDHDPVVSPDGTQLAWLTAFGGAGVGVWDMRTAPLASTTLAPASIERVIGDEGITSRPEWLLDGQGFLTHRVAPGRPTFGIYRVSADGASVVELTRGQPGTNEYPSP